MLCEVGSNLALFKWFTAKKWPTGVLDAQSVSRIYEQSRYIESCQLVTHIEEYGRISAVCGEGEERVEEEG